MQIDRRRTSLEDLSNATVVALTPFDAPDPRLAIAFARAGGLALLDLGRHRSGATAALRAVRGRTPGLGVRLPAHRDYSLAEISADFASDIHVVVVDATDDASIDTLSRAGDRAWLAEACSLEEAKRAAAAGAHGIVAKGSEAAGRVGEETTFVLLQHLVSAIDLPIWARGGIGFHTAAGCIAAGARGVVLDAQLCLLAESSAPEAMRALVAALDGSETIRIGGHRVLSRPQIFALDRGASPTDVTANLGSEDPTKHLVAAGQDAAFAKSFADSCGSVRVLLRKMHGAIAAHLRRARALDPIAPRSAFARAHGVTMPIAQGPMTRVSDRAAFADAVSRAGALPFVALSLMKGDDARSLLEETKALLGDRTWGVGILGFLPPDVREAQLAVVRDVKPPVALIAGGRPSQAEPLEELGIATYLHVPSPGLLDLFLKDGAKKFVLEGQECGGHVGPRSSFVLWESCVERLLREDDLANVHVLFAGGIHDGLSAAMVATVAAPLAARGAKVGVLMGTAYLFTREAVETGAIGPVFQDAAASCTSTVLLETAPGHATRCAATDYARSFEEERARLERAGIESRERWEALEQLNLGRLRIASKGVARENDELVAVPADTQRAEGMFMIGQVAALRSATITMRELHDDVCEGASARVRALELPAPPASNEKSVDVAIVGVASIFPGAKDTTTFFENVLAGKSAITEVPEKRWNRELYFEAGGTGETTPSKWGGFLPETVFEPGEFGIPPRSLAAIDPAQLLSLVVAKRALADAGYADRDFDRERASVIFGAESGTDLANAYAFRATYRQYLGQLPDALDEVLPKLTEDSFPGVLSNVIAGRIANRLDLGGVNYTVDAACASSLAAIDMACKELAAGTSDLVVSGGADLHNSANDYLLFASVHALSPTGQCRTFDAKADGIALGEGVAAVVLKRLEDAERDGDRVYAVIKGVGGSSDGKSLGLTAPRKEGQRRALERAYARAGVSPADVSLLEAHGTGTVVGDKTELATLQEIFDEAGALPGACTLGSVKSQIGHTKCAAGLAGLIKSALAIHHRVLPPTSNVDTPNAAYRGDASAFVFRKTAAPWLDDVRRAGVSAFGFGGTNFHVVLESHDSPENTPVRAWPAELFLLRGARDADLAETIALLRARALEAKASLASLALATAQRNETAPVRAAIVASSHADLVTKLEALASRRDVPGTFTPDAAHAYRPSEVAFVFPGQGSQRPSMTADLFTAMPALRSRAGLDASLFDAMFPRAAFTPAEAAAQRAAITDTRVAQPALGAAGLAVHAALDVAGVRPAMVAGHSYGEIVALAAAGVFAPEDLGAISRARAEAILAAAGDAPGTMASVRAPALDVAAAVKDIDGVVVANANAPDQTVIAGSIEAVARAKAALEAKHAVRAIPVACAFHSPIVAGAAKDFASALPIANRAEIPVYSNTTAAPYPGDADAIRDLVANQLANPVRFADEIEAMYAAGARVFVESGPGRVLTDLVGRILGDRPHLAVACDDSSKNGVVAFLEALAELAVAGIPVDARGLFADRRVEQVSLEISNAPSATAWIVDGQTARPLHGDLPEHAMKLVREPLAIAPTAAAPSSDRDANVADYLRSMRDLVDSQREVMLRYLGDAAPSAMRAQPVDAAPATKSSRISETKSTKPVAVPVPAPSAPEIAASPMETLVAVVSQRTGYPTDMLDLDLDLEADLGVDSIKRIEILGLVSEKLGMKLVAGKQRSQVIEELATVKTLRGIGTWLEARAGKAVAAPPVSGTRAVTAAPSEPAVEEAPVSTRAPARRYVMDVKKLAPAKRNCVTVAGKRFGLAADQLGVAAELAKILEANGAVVTSARSDAGGALDGLVDLTPLDNDPDALKGLFSRAKAAALGNAKWIVAATGLGGDFGRANASTLDRVVAGGANGMLKSLVKEHPGVRVHAVDLDRGSAPKMLAEQIFTELLADDRRIEVGYRNGERLTLEAVAGASKRAASPLVLDRDAVLLVTGGARGITAKIAVAIAERCGCTLELVGRSPAPEAKDDPALANAVDLAAVRSALIARANGAGLTSPAAIEAAAREVLAAREIRATLDAITRAGGKARYHSLDVRDTAKLDALVASIRNERGRLDGIVHGAGLIEDKLLAHKTEASFDRVFDTKAKSALSLMKHVGDDTRFVAFFSSVSSAFGNRGQTDYAAANAVLDALAHHLRNAQKSRVLSVNWGPWAGAGMVRPELEAEYARRGVALIAPDDGAARFLEELFEGEDTQVILTAASPEVLAS